MTLDELLFSPPNETSDYQYTSFCRVDTRREVSIVVHWRGTSSMVNESRGHPVWFDNVLELQCVLIERYP